MFEVLEVALGEQAVGKTQVFEWLFKFKSGVMSGEDVECRYIH
jgi:hypothetical protein